MNGIKNGRISLFALSLLIMVSLACGNSTATRTPESKKIAPTLTSKAAQPTYALSLPMLTSGKSGASACQSPTGWSPITIQAGDTLESLALTYNATVSALIQANCLAHDDLIPGTILYVPGIPPTESSIQCGPPADWIYYTVQPGDTLVSIGQKFGILVAELQLANCMGDSTMLRAGAKILVPNVQPRTPTATPTR